MQPPANPGRFITRADLPHQHSLFALGESALSNTVRAFDLPIQYAQFISARTLEFKQRRMP